MKIRDTIERCLRGVHQDPYHRYRSWDHCNEAFSVSKKNDRLALELGFYLASWGMYRGSSGLLQKNYKVHEGAVDILFSAEVQKLKCTENFEVSQDHVDAIMVAKKQLADHYKCIPFGNSKGQSKDISSTDTLISKVLLGTLGCTPAYDEYFVKGIRSHKRGCSLFDSNSLHYVLDFAECNESEVKSAQNYISQTLSKHYPVMKILDMYFWQIGYEKV